MKALNDSAKVEYKLTAKTNVGPCVICKSETSFVIEGTDERLCPDINCHRSYADNILFKTMNEVLKDD